MKSQGTLNILVLVTGILLRCRQKKIEARMIWKIAALIFLLFIYLIRFEYEVEQGVEARLPAGLDGTLVTMTGSINELQVQGRVIVLDVSTSAVISTHSELIQQRLSKLRCIRLKYFLKNKSSERESRFVKDAHSSHPVGQKIVFTAKLKAIRTFSNPAGFDYELWMLQKKIDASGYIRSLSVLAPKVTSDNISNFSAVGKPLLDFRRFAYERSSNLPGLAGQLVPALIFAKAQKLDKEHWRSLQMLGAVHLLVVSGLHLGFWMLCVGLVWNLLIKVMVSLIGRSSLALLQLRPVLLLSVIAFYCWLAGWGVSLQRGFIMLALGGYLFYTVRNVFIAAGLVWAFVVVALISPLSLYFPGVVFSFLAVSLLLLGLSGKRVGSPVGRLQWLWRPQWLLFVGLTPVMWWFSQGQSVNSFFVNLIAVPVLSFVVLPLSALVLIWPNEQLIVFYNQLLDILLSAMNYAVPSVGAIFYKPDGMWLMLLALVLSYFLAPRHLPFRGVILLLILALSFSLDKSVRTIPFLESSKDLAGRLTVFDVGQGLSVAITDGESTLLYDAGAEYPSGFSLGESVVVPNLLSAGVSRLDTLVISHSDNDHAGGLEAVLRRIRVDSLILGQPDETFVGSSRLPINGCHESELPNVKKKYRRHLPGALSYRFFSIDKSLFSKDNDRSCVLQVSINGVRILLPGDVESAVERYLVQEYGKQLHSDVLVVGHHGSKTSSSGLFLDMVEPQYALISSGFNNRFGHPHSIVLERLSERGVQVFNTAKSGAIELVLSNPISVLEWRKYDPPRWRQP